MKSLMIFAMFVVCSISNADCDTDVNNRMVSEVGKISSTIFKLNFKKLTEPGVVSEESFYYVEYVPGDVRLKDVKWLVVARELANGQCEILSANRISNSF
jgi:hypothetical protein